MKEVFSLLHQHFKARENDLVQELHSIRQTAGNLLKLHCLTIMRIIDIASILKRRKATLSHLQTTAGASNHLDECQLSELIQQMKASYGKPKPHP